MNYELMYKCKNCKIKFRENISEEELRESYGLLSDIMSGETLFELFRNGWEVHRTCYKGWTSYGRLIAIRSVEE